MTRIGPTRTKILLMVIQGHQNGRPPKYRELCEATGTILNNVHQHLKALKKARLVDWEPKKAATLTPLCRFYRSEAG